MSKEKKSSYAVVQERVLFLMPMISMLNRREIFRYVSDKTDWNVTERQIENYIAKAKEELKKDFSLRKKSARELAYNNYKSLYNKSFMIDDYRTCLSIQTRMDSIFGMDQIDEKDKKEANNITINVNTPAVEVDLDKMGGM